MLQVKIEQTDNSNVLKFTSGESSCWNSLFNPLSPNHFHTWKLAVRNLIIFAQHNLNPIALSHFSVDHLSDLQWINLFPFDSKYFASLRILNFLVSLASSHWFRKHFFFRWSSAENSVELKQALWCPWSILFFREWKESLYTKGRRNVLLFRWLHGVKRKSKWKRFVV